MPHYDVMSVPGRRDDGVDTYWYLSDRDSREGMELGRGDLARRQGFALIKRILMFKLPMIELARRNEMTNLRIDAVDEDRKLGYAAPVSVGTPALTPARMVYRDALREIVRVGQLVVIDRHFRLARVTGRARDGRFIVSTWTAAGQRWHHPRRVNFVHLLSPQELITHARTIQLAIADQPATCV